VRGGIPLMLLVMVTCHAPVFMFNGARLAATMTVALDRPITRAIFLRIRVPYFAASGL
jgi:hypothetical protein